MCNREESFVDESASFIEVRQETRYDCTVYDIICSSQYSFYKQVVLVAYHESPQVKQMLLLYFHLVFNKKEKERDAVQFVHDALGISKTVITEARDQFVADTTVRTRDGSQRGGRNGPMAPPGTTLCLREKVEQINKEGCQVTASKLRKWLDSDSSYLHVNHKSNFSWFTIDGDHRFANSNGDDQRIILVHAITIDGPVIADGWREGGTRQGFHELQ